MSIKTILTTIALVAGSSTAALARPVSSGHGPVVVRNHQTVMRVSPRPYAQARFDRDHDRDRDRDRDHRYYNRGRVIVDQNWGNDFYSSPVYVAPAPTYVEPTYAEPTYVQPTYVEPAPVAATAQTSQYIALGDMTGNGIQLSLTVGEDQAFVDQVIIQYADGRQVPLHLDATLNGYNPTMSLGTEGTAILGVTVIGRGAVSALRI